MAGWLTSVPGNNTKAYCKLCKKELHCHRLSLLKHKVTFKHHQKEEQQKLMKIIGECRISLLFSTPCYCIVILQFLIVMFQKFVHYT